MIGTIGNRVSVSARDAGFVSNVMTIAHRALRSVPRDPEFLFPALFMPVFFYAINVGALQDLVERLPGVDYKAFQLPVAILFAVTGVSRAVTMVTDIQSGYFDRLSLTPVNRLAMLLGFMAADLAVVAALSLPVLALGFLVGVRFESGALGMLAFVLLGSAWGLVFTGFPYAIALKTGNPAAVNMSWLIFMPAMFTTSIFVPREVMTGWLANVATYNPFTYLIEALRSLVSEGWEPAVLAKGVVALVAVGLVSIPLALMALRGRARRR